VRRVSSLPIAAIASIATDTTAARQSGCEDSVNLDEKVSPDA
jgi:hypothetical protein